MVKPKTCQLGREFLEHGQPGWPKSKLGELGWSKSELRQLGLLNSKLGQLGNKNLANEVKVDVDWVLISVAY